jgi:restriction endonuclease S subunit
MFLIEKIRETKECRNGHFFFIGDEPSKDQKENHKLWKAVKESKILDLVPTGEIEKIENYMVVHGVQPLFN